MSPTARQGEPPTAAAETETPGPRAVADTATSTAPRAQSRYDDFFALAYADGALRAKTKILVALGASLASGCAP